MQSKSELKKCVEIMCDLQKNMFCNQQKLKFLPISFLFTNKNCKYVEQVPNNSVCDIRWLYELTEPTQRRTINQMQLSFDFSPTDFIPSVAWDHQTNRPVDFIAASEFLMKTCTSRKETWKACTLLEVNMKRDFHHTHRRRTCRKIM